MMLCDLGKTWDSLVDAKNHLNLQVCRDPYFMSLFKESTETGVDMEQSGRRQELIADAQSGLIVYVTVLLLPAGHTRGALMVVLVKYVSVCDISS